MNGEHPSKEKLQRHYDGDLNEQEAAELRQHLRTCAPCKAELQGLERLSDMVRFTTDDAAAASDADFTSMFAEIERRISQPGEQSQPTNVISLEQKRGAASRLNRAMPVLGALALAAAALLMLVRQEPPAPNDASPQYAMLDANHSEVVAVKFGRNAGQVFGIPLADGESVPVVWIDDVDEYEEE
jgi:anti-sigma factor RsiW